MSPEVGLLAVDPESQRIHVHPNLAPFGEYARLDGKAPAVALDPGAMRWLRLHWKQHRG